MNVRKEKDGKKMSPAVCCPFKEPSYKTTPATCLHIFLDRTQSHSWSLLAVRVVKEFSPSGALPAISSDSGLCWSGRGMRGLVGQPPVSAPQANVPVNLREKCDIIRGKSISLPNKELEIGC